MHLIKKCIALLLFIVVTVNAVGGCSRAPTHLPHYRRTRGDNGYKLIVADGPAGYVPGKTYNRKLEF